MFQKKSPYYTKPTNKVLIVLMHVFRVLLGILFTFSGFVKVIDPLGSAYKIEDYLIAFGGFFEYFIPLALVASVALSVFELVLGLNFLFQIHLRGTSIFSLLFMAIMLPLTLYIAIFNPVTDCGCFGDAIVIGNWETFIKNVLLTAMIVFVLVMSKRVHPLLLPIVQWIVIGIFVLVGVVLSVYSYHSLPIIDFRPYKIGANIPEGMKIPEGEPTDVFETILFYEKDGVVQRFTIDNYPNDSTWTFVDREDVLISKGYEPPIHDFTIHDEFGDDITTDIIYHEGYTYLLIMYDLQKTSAKGIEKTEEIYTKALSAGIPFYALTASDDDTIEAFKNENGLTYPFCETDPITLKTIIRANPGLMLIKDGTIIGKWHWRNFEEVEYPR